MKMIMMAAITALMASPVVAQTTPFEFRGETTSTVRSDLATRRNCNASPQGVLCSESSVEIAGIPGVILITGYHKNSLYTLLGTFGSARYLTMLEAFTAKYGAPVMSTEPWQNQAGATFQNDIATWQFSDGTMTLTRMGRSRDRSAFRFVNPSNSPPAEAPRVNF